jgi:hypothetical protein
MDKDLTRRDFLSAAAGAAIGGAIVGNSKLADAATLEAPLGSAPSRDSNRSGEPLDSLIFPRPQHIEPSGADFVLDPHVQIVVPSNPSRQNIFLARSLAHEIGDRFDLHLKINRATSRPTGARIILMGSMANPLVRKAYGDIGRSGSTPLPDPEGYVLHAGKNTVLVAGNDDRGAFYGLQSLRQLLFKTGNQVSIRGVHIRDCPDKPFRGIYLFLPGRTNIPFFKRFVRDYMALYKYNTLIMEMGASMRLDSHPELNSGWVEFARDCNYSCRNYPPGPFHDEDQNSSHQDTADGSFLEKEEVAGLARYVAQNHIELVPELASFTHSYYLLTKHRNLAAVPQNKWPDIYCASNPKCYPLVYEVYDEYIDLLRPKMVHIGHDELFLPVNVSPQCQDKNIGELFGEDVKKIHDHLASKNIQTALWGDMLLESVRGRGLKKRVSSDGWVYYTPGALTPEQVARLIPKDCLIFNWFWRNEPSGPSHNAEHNEATLDRMGFRQVYGNFEPSIQNYETRKKRRTLVGGAPSAWFATNELGFGKELMSTFLGCSQILWTGDVLKAGDLISKVQSMVPAIRTRMSGVIPPSQTETSILPVDISSRFNSGDSIPALGAAFGGISAGMFHHGHVPFDLKARGGLTSIVVGTDGKTKTGLPKIVTGIPIGEAPTSLIFLHASARPANNRESFRLIWDQADTADLLGWYEVVYQDGFTTTIPIRYGVNILECNWNGQAAPNDYCYGADAVPLGGGTSGAATFFSFEWTNIRLGKVIQEVRLKGTTGFRGASDKFNNDWGPTIESNAVILKAISRVQKRGGAEKPS